MAFFDRLSSAEDEQANVRYSAYSTKDTVDSVKRNLEVILNSRKGCSLSSPGLGLQDFNDASVGSVDMCINIAKDIKESIEIYEPRVRVDMIESMPPGYDRLYVSFRMSCSIRVEGKKEKAEIELILDNSNRKFRVN